MENDLIQKYILAIYEYGNLTKAASVLGISQPALSAGLTKAEKKLGFRIFDRRSKPIIPTREGFIYIEYVKKKQRITQEYQRKITDILNPDNGELWVGAPAVYAETMLADVLAQFHILHPKTRIRIKEAVFGELVEKVKSEQLDCFISTSEDLPESFGKQIIGTEQLYLCIPQDWVMNRELSTFQVRPGQVGACFDYRILKEMDFILLEEMQPLRIKMERFFWENDLSPQGCITVNQVSLLLKLAALGMGAAIVSESALNSSKYADKVCVYPLPANMTGRKIYVAYDENRYLPQMCVEFIELLRRMMGDRDNEKKID